MAFFYMCIFIFIVHHGDTSDTINTVQGSVRRYIVTKMWICERSGGKKRGNSTEKKR